MDRGLTRRDFVREGSALAAAAVAGPRFAEGAQDTVPIRVGLIGCGKRGRGAAEQCIQSGPGIKVHALGDLFEDRLGLARNLLKGLGSPVDEDRCFLGFDAYRKVLASDVNLVILATPPGFRPIHFAAAVEAGKHVFMEKPVAVDPVGVRKVIEAGRKAAEKKLGVVAGTQRRHQKCYVETIQRIHDGQIGEVVAGRCYWNQGGLWSRPREEGQSEMEWQIRNWLYFDWLSGDHIVEQHIHNIDVINWVLRSHPQAATAVGGRQVRTDAVYGNIYDHFAVDYEYPNGVHVLSLCRQQDQTDGQIGEAIVGTKGRSDAASFIEGSSPWKFSGDAPNPYVQEHADLIDSIRVGRPLNEARQVAESTLTAILGRQAAYTGKVVKWDELMKSNLDLSPPKYEFGPLAIRPVPMPGRNP